MCARVACEHASHRNRQLSSAGGRRHRTHAAWEGTYRPAWCRSGRRHSAGGGAAQEYLREYTSKGWGQTREACERIACEHAPHGNHQLKAQAAGGTARTQHGRRHTDQRGAGAAGGAAQKGATQEYLREYTAWGPQHAARGKKGMSHRQQGTVLQDLPSRHWHATCGAGQRTPAEVPIPWGRDGRYPPALTRVWGR